MRRKIVARLLAALLVQGTTATAGGLVLLDPVTTHTNGMPLASTDPVRDAYVYGACNPYHAGCCGGRYNCPLANAVCQPNSCCVVRPFPTPDDTPPGITTPPPAAMLDGLETERSVRLGVAPNTIGDPSGGDREPRIRIGG